MWEIPDKGSKSLPASRGIEGMAVQVCWNVAITPYAAKCSDGAEERAVVIEPCAWDLWLIAVALLGRAVASANQSSPSDGHA